MRTENVKKDRTKLTPEQWKMLAFLHIAGTPVHIDTAAAIVQIRPASLMALINDGMQSGYLMETLKDTYSLSPERPDWIESGIRIVATGEFFSSTLRSIEEIHASDQLHPRSIAGILEGAGKLYEAAYAYHGAASKYLSEGISNVALECELSAIDILKKEKPSKDRDALFVSSVLGLSGIYIRISQAHPEIITLLRVAKKLALGMGDKRSSVIIDLHLGRYYFMNNKLSETLDALDNAVRELDVFKDDDMIDQTEQFVGIYYYLKGMYSEASDHLGKAVHSPSVVFPGVADYILILYYAFSCSCTGQFHKAIGVLDAHWRRTFNLSEPEHAYHARAVLGYILIMSGRTEEAISHLKASRSYEWKNPHAFGRWITEAGFAMEAFRSERINEAYDILKNLLTGNFQIRQYPVPAFLEMLAEFDRRKYPAIKGLSFEQERLRILKGLNVHMKGAAFRIMAQNAASASPSSLLIPRYLSESEKYLIMSGDPVELAKTYAEFARYYIRRKKNEKASEYAIKAWENFSGLGDIYLPDDIKQLLTGESKSRPTAVARDDVTARLVKMIGDIIPTYDSDSLFDKVLEAITGFLRAERSALFLFTKGKKNAPILKASRSISRDETDTTLFRSSLSLIFSVRKSKIPASKKLIDNNGAERTSLCIPVEAGPDFDGVMYFESFFIEDTMTDPSGPVQGLLIDIASDAFTKIMRLENARNMTKSLPGKDMSLSGIKDDEIIASSGVMTTMLYEVDKAASTDASILITGETGVGKELVAKRIHNKSMRAGGPFITVNIAGIPETLIESELFGHEKGSFTGADSRHIGRIELAHTGTLFIDELGDIPLSVQIKLLRVLQDRTFNRLGGARSIKSDFRLVTATNKDIEAEIDKGRFRRDLFYRINTFHIRVPPLRERKTDILLISESFIRRFIKEFNKPSIRLSREQEEALVNYPWPGNVRELRNVIERGILLSDKNSIDLNLPVLHDLKHKDIFSGTPTLDELQRRYIKLVIEMTGGRISGKNGASAILGMKRTTLNARMKKLGIR
ncbi:MAG TPA: sigma-54 dependent transcriptional regulator [Desulfomonilia bacterium]